MVVELIHGFVRTIANQKWPQIKRFFDSTYYFSESLTARVFSKLLKANQFIHQKQCWTEGRSSTAIAEDLRPTATATVAEV